MKLALLTDPVRTVENNPFRTLGALAYVMIVLLVRHAGGF